MVSAYSSKYQVLGFGRNQEEADSELILHIARQNIDAPEAQEYSRRRDALYPWNPLPNILHIKGIGSIVRKGHTLTNTRTGESVEVVPEPMTQYLYLYPLLGNFISFSDFSVCAKREIDLFFQAISPIYTTLGDFPFLQPGYVSNAVDIENLEHRCFYCTTSLPNELLVSDGRRVLSVNVPTGASQEGMLAYGFAKLGYIYDGKSVTPCQNAQNDSMKL